MRENILYEWKEDIAENKGKIILSFLFLIIALLLTIWSGDYVDEANSTSVHDLVLDNIPAVNLGFLFTYGLLAVLAVFIVYPLVHLPKKFHYALGMLSLFLCVRSFFLVLTHLKTPFGAIHAVDNGFLQFLSFTNDLFFSGHTGIPFLGFLIFENKKVKYFMLIASIVLAATVLFMHVHYSIDVASAYCITYCIYVVGDKIFGKN